MHSDHEDKGELSSLAKQQASSMCSYAKEDIDISKEYPEIFQRKIRIYLENIEHLLEKMDTVNTSIDQFQADKKANTKGYSLKGSEKLELKRQKRGKYRWKFICIALRLISDIKSDRSEFFF